MNDYMNHTQNNTKSSLTNVNMPSTSEMPMAETKTPVAKSYLPPLMQTQIPSALQPSGMQMSYMGMQPMQFSTPSVQSMPQPPQFGTGAQTSMPSTSLSGRQQGPPPVASTLYIPGFLASIIGRTVRAEFIIGDNQFVDRTGIMVDVGVNYFVLNDIISKQYVMCDLYSVRFVTILT